MWKLLHKLFGRQYVATRYGFETKICRVMWTPAGDPYILVHGNLELLEPHGNIHSEPYRRWHPLTMGWLTSVTYDPTLVAKHPY
jgi:hypothetical protein